eukprot:SAG31_NODE_40130_length_283_cov_0.603261_1_plen_67_part_10
MFGLSQEIFRIDTEHPQANGRPHWSTKSGWHLYYFPSYKLWFLNRKFTPEDDMRELCTSTLGEVPTG